MSEIMFIIGSLVFAIGFVIGTNIWLIKYSLRNVDNLNLYNQILDAWYDSGLVFKFIVKHLRIKSRDHI